MHICAIFAADGKDTSNWLWPKTDRVSSYRQFTDDCKRSDNGAEWGIGLRLSAYVAKEPVDLFVVGLPKQMNNEPSENMKYVEAFVTHLKRTIPNIPVEYYDERFTSVLAHKAMLDGGLKKKKRQDKGLVDEISAVIILQSYLENKKYQL